MMDRLLFGVELINEFCGISNTLDGQIILRGLKALSTANHV